MPQPTNNKRLALHLSGEQHRCTAGNMPIENQGQFGIEARPPLWWHRDNTISQEQKWHYIPTTSVATRVFGLPPTQITRKSFLQAGLGILLPHLASPDYERHFSPPLALAIELLPLVNGYIHLLIRPKVNAGHAIGVMRRLLTWRNVPNCHLPVYSYWSWKTTPPNQPGWPSLDQRTPGRVDRSETSDILCFFHTEDRKDVVCVYLE